MNSRAHKIIDFWFNKTPPEKRFKRDNSFDYEIKINFLEDYNLAKSNEYDDWLNNPKECLALIILLDQFSRNLFRDKKEAFEQDHKARLAVNQGVYIGYLEDLNDSERLFFLLPLIHSEEIIDHEKAYQLLNKYLNNHPDIEKLVQRHKMKPFLSQLITNSENFQLNSSENLRLIRKMRAIEK